VNRLSYNTGAFPSAYSREDRITGQRIVGIAFAVSVEAAIVLALLLSLQRVRKPDLPVDLTVINVPAEQVERSVPPPAAPVFEAPRVAPVEPVVTLTYAPPQERAISQPQAAPPEPRDTPPPSPPAIFTPARIVLASLTTPEYPPLSRRLLEQGTLRLRLSIGAGGEVSDAIVEQSSGYPRLDNAAVAWVKSRWRYQPAMEGTRKVASSLSAVVTFKLE
jgi:periplasmic protein TonB